MSQALTRTVRSSGGVAMAARNQAGALGSSIPTGSYRRSRGRARAREPPVARAASGTGSSSGDGRHGDPRPVGVALEAQSELVLPSPHDLLLARPLGVVEDDRRADPE